MKKEKAIEITKITKEYRNDIEIGGMVKEVENMKLAYEASIRELEIRLNILKKIQNKVKF